MNFRRILIGGAAAAFAAGASSAETWDMPVPYGAENFHTVNDTEFAEDVAARTDGEIEITVHPAGSLFKHPEIKNAVRSGQVPIGEFLLSRLSNESAIYGLDSVPFLATGYEDARKLWEVSRPEIEALLDEEGLMALYAVPWPPQGLYANRPIESGEDMAGLKFRAYNAATERLAQLLDAAPTQVEVPDLAQAFATGRVDSMVTSPSTGVNTKAWDYLSHYYDTRAWLPKNLVVMNKRAFQRLDEATRQAVLDAAAAAQERGWEASMMETAQQTDRLAENGVEVSAPSEALTEDLRAVGDTMTEEWIEEAGETGEKVVEAYRN